jgi:hypothetical protein
MDHSLTQLAKARIISFHVKDQDFHGASSYAGKSVFIIGAWYTERW